MFQHRQPFWYYVPVLILASFPWCLVAFSAFGAKWKNGAWRDSPGLFILCWALFPFLFFSFSQSKLPGYILPAVFPGFLLMGRSAARVLAPGYQRAGLWTGITGALLMVFAGAAARPLAADASLYRVPESHLSVLLLSMFAAGVIAVFLSLKNKQAQAVALIAVLMAAIVIIMNVEILPAADAQISARSLARDSRPLMQPEDSVAVHRLIRNWNYGLSYYFARELPEWKPDDPLPQWLFTSQSEAMKLVRPGSVIRNLSAGSSSSPVLLHTPAAADSAR
jgi:4-amino-4-deoxy-L-arabinose transferase-like glycosyltransferase